MEDNKMKGKTFSRISILAICLPLIFFSPMFSNNLAISAPILYDDFQDGNANGWTWAVLPNTAYGYTVDWSILSDGSYVYSGEGGYEWGGGGGVAYRGNSSLTDYMIQAKVKIAATYNGGSWHGIAGRLQNSGDFYLLFVPGSGGAVITRIKNGYSYYIDTASPSELAQLGIQITSGQWYVLKMIFQGQRIQCFINDILIFDVSNSAYQYGGFGLVNNGGRTNFDDVLVKAIVPIEIDIKPGSYPNSINCKNLKGMIPVAILTTEDFDATTIDHSTVRFGNTGYEASEAHIYKKTGAMIRHEEDVDGDGDLDLVLHFLFSDTDLQCGDEEATLTGKTFDGQLIMGTDTIHTVNY
jgi:hypothetical protein